MTSTTAPATRTAVRLNVEVARDPGSRCGSNEPQPWPAGNVWPQPVRPWMKSVPCLVVFLCLLVSCFLPPTASAADKRPNILFVFSDDHALQAIGAYGSKINQTPHLDRIASEGAVFGNSFCANSICGPSRACILTGKHSHLNGFLRNGNQFDGTQTTFPKLMQDVGYQTAIIGKWHLSTDPTGFNHWEILPGQGNYYNPDFIQMDRTPETSRRLLHGHYH